MKRPDEMIEAFSAAVPFALREMAGVDAFVRDTRLATAADRIADVTSLVRLTAPNGDGRLALCFSEQTADTLAKRILVGTKVAADTDLVQDCIGEVANVVAGQAKTLLVGSPSHFLLSAPTVRAGGADVGDGEWVIWFDSDAGGFAVLLRPPP